MKKILKLAPVKSAIVAGLLLGSAVTQPAIAQTATATGMLVPGLAVADRDTIISNTAAYRAANTQRPVHYKAVIDQAEARGKQLEAQIKPLVDKFTVDSKAPNPNMAALQQLGQQIQGIQQSGQNELNQILRPFAYSQAYVEEQVENMFEQAVKTAMGKKKVSIVLSPQAIFAVNNAAYDLNRDVVNELNLLIPAAQLVPPVDWEPRQVREAKAKQAAQAGPQPSAPATTAGPQPTGR